MKEQKFDAVKMMREIREKLSQLYKEDPRSREKRPGIYKKQIQSEGQMLGTLKVKFFIAILSI